MAPCSRPCQGLRGVLDRALRARWASPPGPERLLGATFRREACSAAGRGGLLWLPCRPAGGSAGFCQALPGAGRPSWPSLALACRRFAAPAGDAAAVVPGAPHGAGGVALAGLAERGGFIPRPDVFDEKLKPGFRGGRALFVFFLCNAVPFAAALYYLREQRTQKTQLSLLALPMAADEVAAESLRVMRTASACFLLHAGGAQGGALRVDPHAPEATAHVPPTEPLPLVPQLERNAITDLLESPPAAGLGFVHFALSRSAAAAGPILAGDRRGSLLYVSGVRGAYSTVTGQLSVLSDAELRRRYWRSSWASSFPSAARPGAPDEPPPWQSEDYVLVRLAVDEASLQAMLDGPQRWEQRSVRAARGASSEAAGASWVLLTPEGAPRARP